MRCSCNGISGLGLLALAIACGAGGDGSSPEREPTDEADRSSDNAGTPADPRDLDGPVAGSDDPRPLGSDSVDPTNATASNPEGTGVNGMLDGASPNSDPNGNSAAPTSGANGASAGSALPPTSDYAARGPFETAREANIGPGNAYTMFRPEPLGADGFVHSPIIFGPGILTTASMYGSLLDHLASHGFVSLSVNSMSGGPNAPANLRAMTDGLDWLIAQNDASGALQGKLAVRRAIAMGYSIGATASTQLSSHEAIMTTVSIHGHNTSGDPHGPILLLTGTEDVIDANRTTLDTLEEAPALLMALPIGHLDVLTELAMRGPIAASSRYIAPITAWLRYWANGDENAKSYFWGTGCEMCSAPWIAPETNAQWDALML
jgi:hypothetical protein